MFPENSIDEFMQNEDELILIGDHLTTEEMKIQLQSYKMMLEVAKQGKTIYTFDQVWLM